MSLDGDGLREIARLVHIGAHQHRRVIGQKLHRDGVKQRTDEIMRLGDADAPEALAAIGFGIGQEHDLAAAGRDLLHVGDGLLVKIIARRDDDDRDIFIDERNRAMLELARRIAFGVNV